jgi:hypothetical protein
LSHFDQDATRTAVRHHRSMVANVNGQSSTHSRTMSKTFFAAVAAFDSSGLDIFATSSSMIALRGAKLRIGHIL